MTAKLRTFQLQCNDMKQLFGLSKKIGSHRPHLIDKTQIHIL